MRTFFRRAHAVIPLALVIGACGSDNALAPQYQPQVVNTPNVVFSFQATDLQNVDDVVAYTWNATSGSVVIHPATSTTGGTIALLIKDAAGAVVYSGTVPPSGDIAPPAATGGAWTIKLTLVNYTGTINFAVQMQ